MKDEQYMSEEDYDKLMQTKIKEVEKSLENINRFTEEELDVAAQIFVDEISNRWIHDDTQRITTPGDWEILKDKIVIVTHGTVMEGDYHSGADLYVLKHKTLIFLYKLYLAIKYTWKEEDGWSSYENQQWFQDYVNSYLKQIYENRKENR